MSPTRSALAVAAAVTVLAALLLTAFAWPAVRSAPHDVPLLVVGPAPAAAQVTSVLASRQPGAFSLRRVGDRAAAEAAVRDREAYGAVVLGPSPVVLTATGGSPAVAAVLTALAAGLGAATEDLAPLPRDDARGVGVAAGALPVFIAGIALGALTSLRVPTVRARLVGLLVGAPLVGLVLTALLQWWLGVLSGSFAANAAVVALGVLATASALAGLFAVGGMRAFGAGAATVMLLGNPLSGAAGAPELLPLGWATLGQVLPPGALIDALRGTAFFDGAATAAPLSVLAGWTLLGLLLLTAGARRAAAPAAAASAAAAVAA